MPQRGPGGKFVKSRSAEAQTAAPTAAPVKAAKRIEIRFQGRDPLELPARFKRPGFVQRLVRIGDQGIENEARIEQLEEVGYKVVLDPTNSNKPVMRRGFLLMEIPEDEYRAIKAARVEANRQANRAQARANAQAMRERMAGLPLPPNAEEGVMLSEVERERPEALITDEELAQAGAPTL